MLIPIGLVAAWESNALSRTFMACVDAGRVYMGANDRQFADCLGVAYSRIAAMRSGQDAGPGFLRFASLPLNFWIGFMKEWGIQFAITVVTNHELEQQIKWLNTWMVRTMRRDAARMYPGESFPDVPEVDEGDEPSMDRKKSA